MPKLLGRNSVKDFFFSWLESFLFVGVFDRLVLLVGVLDRRVSPINFSLLVGVLDR